MIIVEFIDRVLVYKRYIKNEGFWNSLDMFFNKALNSLFCIKKASVFLLSFSKFKTTKLNLNYNKDVEIRQLTIENIESIISSMYFTEKDIIRKLSCGQKCFLIYKNKDLSGYAWTTCQPENVSEIDYWFPASKDCIYIYSLRILRKFRGAKLSKILLHELCSTIFLKSPDKVLSSVVMEKNTASNRLFMNIGFKEIKKITYTKIVFFKRILIKKLS
jgi:hypothetical protein